MFQFAKTLNFIFDFYQAFLTIRILLSWIPYEPPQILVKKILLFIRKVTDPYLNLFKSIIPPLGAIDLSPILAFVGLKVIKYVIFNIINIL